ncbi:MAG: hypothetical protein II319_03810, partial [Clostridia bacterium]|nr:hypothetical protein [Clostridia bacterium]
LFVFLGVKNKTLSPLHLPRPFGLAGVTISCAQYETNRLIPQKLNNTVIICFILYHSSPSAVSKSADSVSVYEWT